MSMNPETHPESNGGTTDIEVELVVRNVWVCGASMCFRKLFQAFLAGST
jgi:hypothetical protein